MNLDKYIIKNTDDIFLTLQKIDKNKKGFLIVVDDKMHAIGTLTDGDIRRAILNGRFEDSNILNFYKKKFKKLTLEDDIATAIELFKNESIRFLPIVDSENKLINILNKNQMHALLLQNIHADLMYDFENLDESIVDYEIFLRPWGFYKTTVMNEYFQSKIICVNPRSQLSLQSHCHREEYWIVAHGIGTVQLEQSVIEVASGSSIFIPKGCKHRLTNTDDKETLIVTEVQIGDYFGEDDIFRYEDIYGRI